VFVVYKVTLIGAIDTRTFRDTTFPLASGNVVRDLGIQVRFVSLSVVCVLFCQILCVCAVCIRTHICSVCVFSVCV